MEEILLP
jgi:hypothetical protein